MKGAGGISHASLGGKTRINVGGGDGSLGRLRGTTCRCRAMASRMHVLSAVLVACVNCHLRSSSVGVVSSNFCRLCDGMERTLRASIPSKLLKFAHPTFLQRAPTM